MRLLSGIGRTAFTVALAAVLAVFSLPVSAQSAWFWIRDTAAMTTAA